MIGGVVKKVITAILIILLSTIAFSQDTIETDLDRYIKNWAASDDLSIIENQELWLFRGYVCAKEGISIQKCFDSLEARGGKEFMDDLGVTKPNLKFDLTRRTVELDDGSVMSLDEYFDSAYKNKSQAGTTN